MRALYERCCGLDVHKKTVVACAITPEARETRTFGTMTADLLALADWLIGKAVTHVAMESTGVFWQPIYNLLEGTGLELLVVNAQHIKAVPGRKTDVRDAEWIAELLQHRLLKASFVPDRVSASCASSSATAPRSSASARERCGASRRRSRAPTSSSPRSPPTSRALLSSTLRTPARGTLSGALDAQK